MPIFHIPNLMQYPPLNIIVTYCLTVVQFKICIQLLFKWNTFNIYFMPRNLTVSENFNKNNCNEWKVLYTLNDILSLSKNWHEFLKAPFLTKDSIQHSSFFSPNDNPSKTMKNDFYFIEKALFLFEILKYLVCFLYFYTLHIQKDKWKWNSSWCRELACIN